MSDFPPPPESAYGSPAPMGPPPNNNLVLAILTTVLCCLPLGIVGIVKAAEVNSKWNAGDFAGAQKSADDAKRFSIIGIVVGVVLIVLYLVLVLGGIFSFATAS